MIRVSKKAYEEILSLLDKSSPKKIAAIKLLRSEANLGLKVAKEAIERLQHEKGFSDHPYARDHGQPIFPGVFLKRVVVDYGRGEIEVDLETLQLRALMEMNTIGIDVVSDILDLVSVLKSYCEGNKIGVIDEEG